ncbi:metalloregulator ArsR/SmtB family transcription factor [Nocardioidaceae bacterium]|nr:metalloregulator ArsR/SmtB family transcription factor [Nocardioidaceae bacterium]
MSPKPLPDLPAPVPARQCCAPLGQAPLTSSEADELAWRLKALADGNRLRLLSLLLSGDGPGLRTRDLVDPLGLTQPTVTHHLRQLVAAGLVTAERRSSESWYAADRGTLQDLGSLLLPDAAGAAPESEHDDLRA